MKHRANPLVAAAMVANTTAHVPHRLHGTGITRCHAIRLNDAVACQGDFVQTLFEQPAYSGS